MNVQPIKESPRSYLFIFYIIIISFFFQARMEVEDLFTDLADGKKLLKLLEIISGEKLGKPNNGRMRVHKVENVNKSLAFLHTKVRNHTYLFIPTSIYNINMQSITNDIENTCFRYTFYIT